jgi:hypothetical protein
MAVSLEVPFPVFAIVFLRAVLRAVMNGEVSQEKKKHKTYCLNDSAVCGSYLSRYFLASSIEASSGIKPLAPVWPETPWVGSTDVLGPPRRYDGKGKTINFYTP